MVASHRQGSKTVGWTMSEFHLRRLVQPLAYCVRDGCRLGKRYQGSPLQAQTGRMAHRPPNGVTAWPPPPICHGLESLAGPFSPNRRMALSTASRLVACKKLHPVQTRDEADDCTLRAPSLAARQIGGIRPALGRSCKRPVHRTGQTPTFHHKPLRFILCDCGYCKLSSYPASAGHFL